MKKLYNTLVPVVAMIEAESPEQALATLRDRLSRAGFEPYDEGNDAFESEPLA